MYSLNGLLGPEGSFSFAEDSTGKPNSFFPKEDEQYNNYNAFSLAERMEEDKLFHLNLDEDDHFLEASSNMRDLIEMSHVEEVFEPEKKEASHELDHQKLIEEMETFLQTHETGYQAQNNLPEKIEDECPVLNQEFNEAELMESEDLLDSLLSELNDVDGFNIESLIEEDVPIQEEIDSGVGTDLNVTIEEGSNVIFVITPSFEEENSAPLSSPASSDDTDWSPSPSVKSSGKIKKKPYGPRRSKLGLQDKKERKKLQNVEAARRYRDKKKTEQQLLDEEVDELVKRNLKLKEVVAEKENEVKTLKKLLQEMGLVSFINMPV